ncbi:hypothetical protein SAMN05444359_111115 [Neolewinella agarilytica]|uniref:DUF1853 family protein n=1 Tax=Neolewinella agarilytica TaxID=478744 RepID=A0A1H9GUR7_9BACT|nr:hypothetical protein SAMN05444359_111115 [Neolewinella agarilytica]
MDAKTKSRYRGYLATQLLWVSEQVSPFPQIKLNKSVDLIGEGAVFKHRRLGKLVEEFVFHQLKNEPSVTWISDNLQIQDGKRTVGEMDALYYEGETPIHLEVAYKFYLYDTVDTYTEPLAYWIGPNRKDNLSYKLTKLHRRQFPLLHHPLSKPLLAAYGLAANTIVQKLCFKAQLFLPYQNRAMDVGPLNKDCIAGFYISYSALRQLAGYVFFLPAKLDWIVIPHPSVTWLEYAVAVALLEADIRNGRSPMIWIKGPDGKIRKGFVVFW